MTEAAATALAPEPAPATDALLMQAITELKACRAANEAARAERGDLSELILTAHRLAELQDKLYQVAMSRTLAEIGAAAESAAEPARHSHRAPRSRPAGQERALRAVREGGVVGGLVAAFRHSWAAHPVATAATGFTAATLATAAVVAPQAGITLPFGASTSRIPNPAASVVAATPVIPPSQIAAAITRPKTGKGSARTLTALVPPSVPAYTQPAYIPPADTGQVPAPEPSSQQQAPAEGQLSVSTAVIDATGTGTGMVTLTCSGGECPWHVVARGVLSADVRQGTLDDGGTATVTISVDPAALVLGGSGTVTVWPGGIRVPVSWSAPVVPSPADTTLPVELPSVLPTIPVP